MKTRTEKVIYYRRSRYGGRFWNWTRKVEKRSTPLKRMWKSEKAAESTALVLVKPAPMVAVVMAPMVPTNLSGAKAIANNRMAG